MLPEALPEAVLPLLLLLLLLLPLLSASARSSSSGGIAPKEFPTRLINGICRI
mgnify:CR=1 FL=1